jgi:hypothetical protein
MPRHVVRDRGSDEGGAEDDVEGCLLAHVLYAKQRGKGVHRSMAKGWQPSARREGTHSGTHGRRLGGEEQSACLCFLCTATLHVPSGREADEHCLRAHVPWQVNTKDLAQRKLRKCAPSPGRTRGDSRPEGLGARRTKHRLAPRALAPATGHSAHTRARTQTHMKRTTQSGRCSTANTKRSPDHSSPPYRGLV